MNLFFLQAWHPSDPSAKIVLVPWREAFGARDFAKFLSKIILPKLDMLLQNFDVNPANQVFFFFKMYLGSQVGV
jgi:tuftelin-interacting protein 11